MKIYIHKDTGVATAALGDTTPLATLTAVLGATYHLDCVFHDGTTPVELASGSNGVLVVKQDKQYSADPLFGAPSWTKFSSPSDGYRFTTIPTGSTLLTQIANLDTVPLMAQVTFLNGGDLLITQKISFVVENSGYRVDETVAPPLPSAWPAPDTIALKSSPILLAPAADYQLPSPAMTGKIRGDEALFLLAPSANITFTVAEDIKIPDGASAWISAGNSRALTSGKEYLVKLWFNGTAWLFVSLEGGF